MHSMIQLKNTSCGSLQATVFVNDGETDTHTHTHTLTWEQGVLYAEHGRPAAGVHGLHELLLVNVSSAVLNADASLHVVEMAAIQLEELYEQDAQVLAGVTGVDAWVELKKWREQV